MSGYAHPEVLVDTPWVAEHLTAPKVRIIEVGYDLSHYASGHIPGAHNIPLFTNEERAIIGTLYVQVGKDPAVERGLELVGPKLADFVRQARELSAGKPLFLYCWRGGMRSGSMAWLFRTAGFKTFLLKGGYKAYRRSFIDLLDKYPWKIVVLGGPTGCGKTEILHRLQEKGQQVIDLEGLAHHKGSAFGALGEPRAHSGIWDENLGQVLFYYTAATPTP